MGRSHGMAGLFGSPIRKSFCSSPLLLSSRHLEFELQSSPLANPLLPSSSILPARPSISPSPVDWLATSSLFHSRPSPSSQLLLPSPLPSSPEMPSKSIPKSPSPFLTSIEEDGPYPPHVPPISHPRSNIDADLYESLSNMELEFLSIVGGNPDRLVTFSQQWAALQSQILQNADHHQLSNETLELFDDVSELITSICEVLVEGEDRREEIGNQLLEKLSTMFDADPSLLLGSEPPKSQSGALKHKKPSLQSKRAPTDNSKTHRKRRAESGIPGQESLKFRPCRDFFMEHLSDPYPNSSQKQELMRAAGINSASLNQWFTNTRRRSNWMNIMKDHAHGRKEDMKVLVDRTLAPPEAGLPPVSEEAREAILKMRRYVDELAREVVSGDFLAVLEELKPMTEAEALQYQDNLRNERKKRQLMKKESRQQLDEDGDDAAQSDDEYRPSTGEKRKRTAGPSNPAPLKKARESTSTSLDAPRQSLKRSRDNTPASSSFLDLTTMCEQSPVKRPRISTDLDDDPTYPPAGLPYRRTTTLERPPPLSASSTLVEGVNVSKMEMSLSPSLCPSSTKPFVQEVTFSFDDYADLEWPNGVSTIDVAAAANDLVQNAQNSSSYAFNFDSSAYTDGSINARNASVLQWAQTLVEAASPDLAPTPPSSTISSSPPPSYGSSPSAPKPQDEFWNDLAIITDIDTLLPSTPMNPMSTPSAPIHSQPQTFQYHPQATDNTTQHVNIETGYQQQAYPSSNLFTTSAGPPRVVDHTQPHSQADYLVAPYQYENSKQLADGHISVPEYTPSTPLQEPYIRPFYATAS